MEQRDFCLSLPWLMCPGVITQKKRMLSGNHSGLLQGLFPSKSVPYEPPERLPRKMGQMALMCSPTGRAAFPLQRKACGLGGMQSLLCFLGRAATYPSQCQSQIVCPANLFVGCEPVRGLDSDCTNIYSRSQRPVGRGDAIR